MGCGKVEATQSRGTSPDFRSERLVGKGLSRKVRAPLCGIKVKTLNEGTCHPRWRRQWQIKMLSRDRGIAHWRIVGTPQKPVPVVSLGRHWNSYQTSVLSYWGLVI